MPVVASLGPKRQRTSNYNFVLGTLTLRRSCRNAAGCCMICSYFLEGIIAEHLLLLNGLFRLLFLFNAGLNKRRSWLHKETIKFHLP